MGKKSDPATTSKGKKAAHPFQGLNVALAGPFVVSRLSLFDPPDLTQVSTPSLLPPDPAVRTRAAPTPAQYSENEARTVVMHTDEESTAPIFKKMGATFTTSISKKTNVVIVGDRSRMAGKEDNPLLKRVLKAAKAREGEEEKKQLQICTFEDFVNMCDEAPALHRCLVALNFGKMAKPTPINKRTATQFNTLLKKGGSMTAKFSSKTHSSAAATRAIEYEEEPQCSEPCAAARAIEYEEEPQRSEPCES